MTLFDSGADVEARESTAADPGEGAAPQSGRRRRRPRRPRSRAARFSLVFAIIIAVVVPGSGIAWGLFHERITDQIAVWQYAPTPEIAQMATDSGMNDEGRFYFYASAPTVESAADFTQVCGGSRADFVLLGCYTGTSIHVFDVTDARLSVVRGVTAAHEMLHAVYARLNDTDRAALDVLLEAEYQNVKDDPELAARMQSYATSEPGQRDNELHSIFGTELATLSPELEAHYAAYFADRSKVVALNASFEAVFSQVEDQAATLATQLTAAGDSIESASSSYTADMAALNADVEAFNARADSGDFPSQQAFADARGALTARSDALDARYTAIQADIAHYDDLRAQLQAVDSQATELNRSIDSTLQAPPSGP